MLTVLTGEPLGTAAQIVEQLFGANMHAELIRRSGVILTYMADRGALTPSHVTMIVLATVGKHETVLLVRVPFHLTCPTVTV